MRIGNLETVRKRSQWISKVSWEVDLSLTNIAYAVSVVSQFMHSSYKEHLEAVYRILRYLKSTIWEGLFFKKSE